MFPPLPLEPARPHALTLMEELDSGQTPFSPQDNLMFGVLVCREPESRRQVVLRAFSGQFRGGWLVEGWVPPLMDVAAYQQQVASDDGEIQAMTASSREFALVHFVEKTADADSGYAVRLEKAIRDFGFYVRMAAEQDIMRLLAVYYQQDVATEVFERFDGERWFVQDGV